MKIRNIICFAALALLMCSCSKVSDWMEKQDTGDLQFDDIWTNENYVEGWLNNCLTAIPGHGWVFSGGEPLWCLTDEGWSSNDASGALAQRIYDGNFSSQSWPAGRGLYSSLLYCIRNINIFLRYIELPETPVKSEEARRRMTADAYVLRAYYMLELFMEYGPLYLYNEDGVAEEDQVPEYLAYVTDITDTYENLRRVPALDYVNHILADCDRGLATDELPWRITLSNESARMTKALAWALKARAMLYLASPLYSEGGDYWEQAYQMHRQAVDLLSEHGYELYTKCTKPNIYSGKAAAYREYYCESPEYSSNPADKETIYLRGGASANYASNYIGSRLTGISSCGTCPTQEMVDAYETSDGVPVLDLANPYKDEKHLQPNFNPENKLYNDQRPYDNRDPRFEQCIMHHGTNFYWDKQYTVDISAGGKNYRSILPTDISQSRTGYYYCKSIPPDCKRDAPRNGASVRQYKFSELLLDLAECAVNAKHYDDAIEAVNEIRSRVEMPALPEGIAGDPEQLRLRVYNERRVELAFEETRYFDIRRRLNKEDEIPGIKYLTGVDVTYAGDWSAATYKRVCIREAEPRHGYEPQCKLSPLPKSEVSNLKVITGVDFQNYGWE